MRRLKRHVSEQRRIELTSESICSEEARRLALKAAGGAAALLREREELAKDLATNALVDEIFSAAYDLLLGTGMDPTATLRMLKEAVGHPLEPS